MKKIISIVLVFCFIFSLSSCGKKDKTENTAKVDLEYYAKLGEIPECKYKLGANIDELNADLEAESKKASETEEEYVYSVSDEDGITKIDNGTYIYYYEKDKKEKGVSYIISYDSTAYGLNSGASIIDVKKDLTGFDYTEEPSENIFFLYGVIDCEAIKYTFDNVNIIFIFAENSLIATVIYDSNNWQK